MLLCTRSAARYTLDLVSDGHVNSQDFLLALNINSSTFTRSAPSVRNACNQPWSTRTIRPTPAVATGATGDTGATGVTTPLPLPGLVTANFPQMRGPTPESNWMVPGRVLTGRYRR